MPEERKEPKIVFPERLHGGVYANAMAVTHAKEEFLMDFIMMAPQGSTVTSRVIISPGHLKRIIAALQENMEKYEKSYGKITVTKEPNNSIEFKP